MVMDEDNIPTGEVTASIINLERFGRDLGALHPWEELKD